MKHGVENHPKFKTLQRELGRRIDVEGAETVIPLPLWQTKGLLESIWGFTAQNSPRGDIGRFTDEEICVGIEYGGDPVRLIQALLKARWVVVHPLHRLVVHDWTDHCADYIKKRVARSGEGWAMDDGGDPSSDIGGQNPPIGGRGSPPADNGGQRRTTDADGCLTDTETDTSTNDQTSEIEKITQSDFKGPSSTGAILGSVLGDLQSGGSREDLLKRIRTATGDGDEWLRWWADVLDDVWDRDEIGDSAIGVIVDGLAKIADGTDPVRRRAKDEGEITTPGRFLTARILEWARKNRVSLPEMPHRRKDKGAA